MASAPHIPVVSSHHSSLHQRQQQQHQHQQEEEFLRTWTPPTPQTTISSQVRAVVEETGLTSSQVQYVIDWYRHRHRRDITLKALLDECDKYQGGQKVFPEKVLLQNASTTLSEGGEESGSRAGGDVVVTMTMPGTANTGSGQQPIRNRESTINTVGGGYDVVDGPPDSGFGGAENEDADADEQADSVPSVQTTSSVTTSTRSTPRRNGTGRRPKEQTSASGARRTSAASMMDDDNAIRVEHMSPMERERWILKNVLLALQREREILDQARKCTSCKTRVRDITFLPCGHFTMCKACSEPVYECPTCQRDILATAQTFLS